MIERKLKIDNDNVECIHVLDFLKQLWAGKY